MSIYSLRFIFFFVQYFIHFVDSKNGIVTIVKMLPIECNWETICLIVSWLHRIDILYMSLMKSKESDCFSFSFRFLTGLLITAQSTDVIAEGTLSFFFSSLFIVLFRIVHRLGRWPFSGMWWITSQVFDLFHIFAISSSSFSPVTSYCKQFLKYFPLVCIQVLNSEALQNWPCEWKESDSPNKGSNARKYYLLDINIT